MKDYLVKIDDDIAWWDEEVYQKVFDKEKHEVILHSTTDQIQKYLESHEKVSKKLPKSFQTTISRGDESGDNISSGAPSPTVE